MKLKEKEQWFASILRCIDIPVIITDTRRLVTFINPVAEVLTGWKQEDVLGKDVTEVFNIIDEQTRKQIENPVKRVLSEGNVTSFTNHALLVNRDRIEIPIDGSAAPIRDDKNSITGVVLTFRDITKNRQMDKRIFQHTEELEKLIYERTERIKRLERQRMESEKLISMGQMSARIAHEINNPLTGIKFSFLLIKDAIPKNHKYYEYVGRIDKEINRISKIVLQMYDLYRPDGKSPKEFDINVTIRDVLTLLKESCYKHDVTVDINTCGESIIVNMSEGLLRQVLFNIIQNAIEASPKGGFVKVAVREDDDNLSIIISDHGSGIPDELRSCIFEPFFTTKSNSSFSGLGLGLSISKGLVEKMKGSLDFNSEKGMGTVFTIKLPLRVSQKRKNCNGLATIN